MGGSGARIKVLSVVGAGRSGTTVLASILGDIEGFASAGELRWLWERGVRAGRPCGCGEPPERCPVWSSVVATTLEVLAAETPARNISDIVAAQHDVGRRTNLPRVLRDIDRPDDWDSLRLVRRATWSACSGLAEVTGSSVVVDISKRPVDAAVIAGLPCVDQYVLHVVRDPRAVVHSWHRQKSFTAAGRTTTMGTRGLVSTVRRWTGNSLSAEALRRRVPPSRWMSMRYEDFAAEPRLWVEAVLSFLDEAKQAPFTDDHTALLGPNHIVAGNPSRFTTGWVAIRPDDEWRRVMPPKQQRLVGALTLPLMWRYGYVEGHGHRHDVRRSTHEPAEHRNP